MDPSHGPRACLVVLLAGLLACETDPPELISAEVDREVTSRETVRLLGVARRADRVEVVRTPALDGAVISTGVDAFTGAFFMEVPLAPATENDFEIVAVSATGDRSDAWAVRVRQEPVRAHGLTLELVEGGDTVSAGAVLARVTVIHPEADADLSGLPVDFEITEPGGAMRQVEASTDGVGRAEVLIGGLTRPGVHHVLARSADATDEAELHLEGDPSLPATVQVDLAPENPEDAGEGPVTLTAGGALRVEITVRDGTGTVIDDAAVAVATDAPGAEIVDGRVVGATAAGTYLVVAMASDSAVWGAASFTVRPGPPDAVALWLSHDQVLVGEPVRYRIAVEDAFGNAVDDVGVTLAAEPEGDVLPDGERKGEIRFDVTADAVVTARAGVDGPVASRNVRVAAPGDAAASVALIAPAHGLVRTVGGTMPVRVHARAGDGITEIVVVVEIDGEPSPTLGTLVSGGPTETVAEFETEVPTRLAVMRLTPTVVDRMGRRVMGPTHRVLVHPSVEVAEGAAVRYVAGGPAGGLDGPVGMALQTPTTLLVAEAYGERVTRIDLQTGVAEVFLDLPEVGRDVAVDPESGHVFVAHAGGVVARFTAGGDVISASWASVPIPFGMHLDAEGTLYVAGGADRVFHALQIDDVTAADPGRSVVLDCGGVLAGSTRAVIRGDDEEGQRVLYATSTSASGLYRCTDDGAGGEVAGTMLTNEGLGWSRQLVRLEDGSFLVANAFHGDVKRLTQDETSWTASPVLSGLDWPVGLLRLPDGRILVSDADEHLVYALTLPSE